MRDRQQTLPFGPIRNNNLFSNHWLEHRLILEPEWEEFRSQAIELIDRLAKIWVKQCHRVEKYSEPGLEEAFIQPILYEIGWKLIYQTFLRGRKPDYALFLDDENLDAALNKGRNSPEFWKFPVVVADAKSWDLNLDRPTIVNNQKEYPPEQIEWYINQSNCDYGILTNGRLWRLFPRKLSIHQPRFETYLEFDIVKLLESWPATGKKTGQITIEEHTSVIDDFLMFYLFFSPKAFQRIQDRRPLIERAAQGSNEYRLGVGEGIKDRVFEALRICIKGFLEHKTNNLNPQTDIQICKEQSFILLYRLLFIMYAEDRDLLPYRTHRTYAENRSLRRFRDDIANRINNIENGKEFEYKVNSTNLWEDLTSLFDLLDRGGKRYGVPAYNSGLFDPEENPFLAEKVLSDFYLTRVIDQLGRAPDKEHPDAGLFRVDYRDLSIQHLGNVYEGLLELQPHYAVETMIGIRKKGGLKKEEKVFPSSSKLPKGYEWTGTKYEKYDVYLQTDKGERRSSGSYYTPNHIVEYIVRKTLGPICASIHNNLEKEIKSLQNEYNRARGNNRKLIGEKLEKLNNDYDDRILHLNILDPAMGSGHFLLSACQYLAEEIATNPNTGDPHLDQLQEDESILTYWKRQIVEHCLCGVDINPLAVELAKVALWMETASINQPLTFLDHHLRHGNSLVGGWVYDLGALTKGRKMPLFIQKVSSRLPILLEPLKTISTMPSDTAEQVKEKAKIYRQAFDKVRKPFLAAANLWCANFFLDEKQQIAPSQYDDVLQTLDKPKSIQKFGKEGWFQNALNTSQRSDVACFHWELEFPEVFFDLSGRREEAGFDAVIGNPPYDVLSEKETGHDLSALKRFLRNQEIYESSFRGKNNLYKLFICLALALLKDSGRMGFITPMPILGDDQAADIRRQILKVGAFTSVDAFPQKDDPSRRVFPEAKLSTAVFTVIKTNDTQLKNIPLTSRVHPARYICDDSPTLKLTTDDIAVYDPSNMTIVSCSQEDWDLAIKITKSGRMARLKEYAEFFQGEVNETNEREKGNLLTQSEKGKLVTRGACICLYIARKASQGTDLYLNIARFLKGKGEETKAYHHRYRRIGLQESCPQNNFRRIISSFIIAGEYCNHTVNYCPENHCSIPLEIILSILNSKLADWYFRLGSTNAHVSHYQLYNLPCPQFADQETGKHKNIFDAAIEELKTGDLEQVFNLLNPGLKTSPFNFAVRDIMVELVQRIIKTEQDRGDISRAERSRLSAAAQPYQDLIDKILFAMAGLTEPEANALEKRLKFML